MLVGIANKVDSDQTDSLKQSDLGLHGLVVPLWQASSPTIEHFRTGLINHTGLKST